MFLLAMAINAFLLYGCYTHLSYGEITESRSDSKCEGCREEVPFTGGSQVCVWERDFYGYPELRCYYTGYSSSWLYFHNTPWWYRSNYGWHDTRGCPPYYYYNRGSGNCHYYYSKSHPGTNIGAGGSNGGNASVDSPRPKPQSRSITSEAATQPQTPITAAELWPASSGNVNNGSSHVVTPPITSPLQSTGSGMILKPSSGGTMEQTSKPEQSPAEQKPIDQNEKHQNERPRPSMRGM